MVDGVRVNGAGPTERVARQAITVDKLQISSVQSAKPSVVASLTSPALLASQGAPIDGSKVASIRAGIADGTYRVDPDSIALAMMKADLPID